MMNLSTCDQLCRVLEKLPSLGHTDQMSSVKSMLLCLCRYYLLHYTYGMDYNRSTGEHMPGKYGEWRFDKRSYAQFPPPRNLDLPPDVVSNELVSAFCCTLCL